jgi:hypothetical protein
LAFGKPVLRHSKKKTITPRYDSIASNYDPNQLKILLNFVRVLDLIFF